VADDLERQIIVAFEAETSLVSVARTVGRAGNAVTRRTKFLIQEPTFDINRTKIIAETAVQDWGGMDAYTKKGSGGADNCFRVNFGNETSHVFCDVLAYYDKKREGNVIEILMNLVE